MPRRRMVVTEDTPSAAMTWLELARRPAQVIINLMAVAAFMACLNHLF